MDDGFTSEDTGSNASWYRRSRISMSELGEGGWYSSNRNSTQLLALGDEKLPEFRHAKPHGLFEHCVEH